MMDYSSNDNIWRIAVSRISGKPYLVPPSGAPSGQDETIHSFVADSAAEAQVQKEEYLSKHTSALEAAPQPHPTVRVGETPLGGKSFIGYLGDHPATEEYSALEELTAACPDFENALLRRDDSERHHAVISVPVKFPEQERAQRRLMLVLSEDDSCYYCINFTSEKNSSRQSQYSCNILIPRSEENGLNYDSYAKCNVRYAVSKENKEIYRLSKISLNDEEFSAVYAKVEELEAGHKLRTINIHKEYRDDFSQYTDRIEETLQTFQLDAKQLSEYIAFSSRFYQYSPRNQLLIYLQNPHASFVASYTKWEELGYHVKKGARCIRVLCPAETATFQRESKAVSLRDATNEEKLAIAQKKIHVKKEIRFIRHNVFDISQTTCPPGDYPRLLSMGYSDLNHSLLYENLKEYVQSCGIPVLEQPLESIVLLGFFDCAKNEIVIHSALADTERLNTLLHEFSHAVLHRTSTQPAPVVEFEAESMAFMLQQRFGLEPGDNSKQYICAQYQRIDQASFDIKACFSRMGKAFQFVTHGVEETLTANGITPQQTAEKTHSANRASGRMPEGQPPLMEVMTKNFLQGL